MDKARKSELNRAYREKNRDRIREQRRLYREANREAILAYNRARRKPKPPNTRRCPEAAAIILILQQAQRKSGQTMSEFVGGLSGCGNQKTWRAIREVYQNWRDTDEGQSLVGDT